MMSKPNLGRLISLNPREYWQNEAIDFTPWLGKPENLELLGETLGLELELEGLEQMVGPFRADILCKDTATNTWVLIENQLERTDHTHLGQLITYAAGLEAVTIVWIANRFSDEHRAALDWLNEKTSDDVNFFGLEIELWQIEDSPLAPKFNLVSRPNDWSKTVAEIARNVAAGGLSETRQLYLNFWTEFREYIIKNTNLNQQKPSADSWITLPVGRTNFYIQVVISVRHDRLGVSLVIDGPDAKAHYFLLEEEKEQIESEMGVAVEWRPLLDKKESHVVIQKSNVGLQDQDNFPQHFAWLADIIQRFDRVFRPRIKSLKASEYLPEITE